MDRPPCGNLGPAQILAAEEARLLACVHCGFCLPACPTYTELGDEADSPRGRLHLMRAVAEGRLEPDSESFARHIDQCLGCRACETACPSGVEYGHLLERAREVVVATRGTDRLTGLLLRTFGSRAATRIAMAGGRAVRALRLVPLLLRVLPERLRRIRLGLAMLGSTRRWAGLRSVPSRAGEVVGPASPGKGAGGATGDLTGPGKGLRVAVLTGCVQAGLLGRVNEGTELVLRANGCRVMRAPDQVCCGALHAHAGARERARELARSNIMAFEAAGIDRVIVNAAGCGAALKGYGELLADDEGWAGRAREFSARVSDLFEFLADLGPIGGASLDLRVTYDPPCHLYHAQRVVLQPAELLTSVTGVELVPLPGAEECCGGAGIYGITNPELGGRIMQKKVDSIRGSGADVVVTANPGCMMQIGAGLLLSGSRVPALHPVELMAESYRRAGYR